VRLTINGQYSMDVELFAGDVPETVANFLAYVGAGSYTNTIIHRSTTGQVLRDEFGQPVLDPSGNEIPVWVIQGGGFGLTSVEPVALGSIPTNAPIPLQAGLSNVRGTLAMARTNDPNSATSQWFFNVSDNSVIFDPIVDLSSGTVLRDGYAVFGRIIPNVQPPLNPSLSGYDLLDAIAGVPYYDARSFFPGFPVGELPLLQPVIAAENFIFVTSIAAVPEPSTWALAGIGIVGAALAGRRRISSRRASARAR
jgi:cyclophilin family peptidyl-prolyl cis-trans isomerase